MGKTWSQWAETSEFAVTAARNAKAHGGVEYIDSHTEGEPTRVVVAGAPALPGGPVGERQSALIAETPDWRGFVVDPPRGSAELVGALLMAPETPGAFASALFFNNVGFLRMCVHASIGIARTLAYLGAWPGAAGESVRIDTVSGTIALSLHPGPEASVENVKSYRTQRAVRVQTSRGVITGDVAFGGNWFFIARGGPFDVRADQIEGLTDLSWEVRRALADGGISGSAGEEIDHVQLVGPPTVQGAQAKNFVLCPGGAYDRSPCGTGTSALMACLADDGELADGQEWCQESVTGSTFVGRVQRVEGGVVPTVRGRAFMTGRGHLVRDPQDPPPTRQ